MVSLGLNTGVWHDTFGGGSVMSQDSDGGVVVDFGNGSTQHLSGRDAAKLQVLSNNGLEALIATRPDEVRSWVKEAPLKLLAATLTDVGRNAKAGAVRSRLEGRVLTGSVKWVSWWESVRSAARDSSHFRILENKKGAFTAISLRAGVNCSDVPAEPLPERQTAPKIPKAKPTTKAQWKNWFLSDTHLPPPGPSPASKLPGDLPKWPASDVERAIDHTLWATAEFVNSRSGRMQVGAGWLQAVTEFSLRWRECAEAISNGDLTFQTGQVLPRLLRVAKNKDGSTDLSLLREALSGLPDEWRKGFMGGIWAATRERLRAVLDMLDLAAEELGHFSRSALTKEICLAAFNASDFDDRTALLDRLVGALPVRERVPLIRDLLLSYSKGDAPLEKAVDYVKESAHAERRREPDGRLSLLILAALLVGDNSEQVAGIASAELADAFESPDVTSSSVQLLFGEVRRRNESWRHAMSKEVEARRQEHEAELNAELEGAHRERDRLSRQSATFRAAMESGREESRLEVREGMLLAVGDALQRAHRQGASSEQRLKSVMAALGTALREGDAEQIGTVGESVGYNPKFHHSAAAPTRGTVVRVMAPGVIVRSNAFGDRVILKASVVQPQEVN